MNKNFQLEQLGMMLMEPGLKSGLYLIDTDLTDEEIEWYIKESGCCSYMRSPCSHQEVALPLSCLWLD